MSSRDDVKKIELALKKAVARAKTRDVLEDVGEQAATDIKTHTRLGFKVDENEQPFRPLPGLKPVTVERRRNLRKAGKLSSKTQPGKANNIKTGELVDSIKHRENVGLAKTTVGPLNPKGNKKVRELNKMNRGAIALSRVEIGRVTKVIEEAFNKALKLLGL